MAQNTKSPVRQQPTVKAPQVDGNPDDKNDQILGDIERIVNPAFEDALAGKPTNPNFPRAKLEANKNAPDLTAGNKANAPDNKPELNNQGPKGP